MNEEIWVDIKGYEESYQVSNLGRIKAKNRLSATGRKLKELIRKPHSTKYGYLLVNLCKNGTVKHYTIHRLVAEAFIPNPENKEQVNHKDGNKSNNHLSNLEWSTRSENINHAIKTGLLKNLGTSNHKSKLTEYQVKEMRALREINPKKFTYKKLGELFGVTSENAQCVVKRHNWKHVI